MENMFLHDQVTLRKSVKYIRIIPSITPRSGHIKKKPALKATKMVRGEQQAFLWCTYPKKKKGKYQYNKPKSVRDNAVTEEKERTHRLDRLNIGDPALESEN